MPKTVLLNNQTSENKIPDLIKNRISQLTHAVQSKEINIPSMSENEKIIKTEDKKSEEEKSETEKSENEKSKDKKSNGSYEDELDDFEISGEDSTTFTLMQDTTAATAAYTLRSYIERLHAATKAYEIARKSIDHAAHLHSDFSYPEEDYINDIEAEFINKLLNYDISNHENWKNYQSIFEKYLIKLNDVMSLYCKSHSAKEFIAKADSYNVLVSSKPSLATVTNFMYNNEQHYLIQTEVPLPALNTVIAEEYLQCKIKDKQPLWYKGMSAEEKILFDYAIKDCNTTQDVLNNIQSISSILRTVPGVPNFSRHVTYLLDETGKVVNETKPRYRSSMVASRDIEKSKSLNSDCKKILREKFTEDNIQHIIQTFFQDKINSGHAFEKISSSPILLQTLISPIIPPDNGLYDDKLKAIAKLKNGLTIKLLINGEEKNLKFKPNIIETNHPLNAGATPQAAGELFGRFQQKFGLKSESVGLQSKENGNALLKQATIYYNIHLNKKAPDFRDIVNQYNSLLNHTDTQEILKDIHKANHREMHLAALEELMVMRMGALSYGSCVSGKDRKGLQTIYVDAMEIYYLKYNKFPEFKDTSDNRKNFIDVFSTLYASRHQQLNAGQNAKGANGIKTPPKYLPDDFVKEIQRKMGMDEPNITDQLASNNEFEHALSKAKKLSGDEKLKLIDEINSYVPLKHEAHSVNNFVSLSRTASTKTTSTLTNPTPTITTTTTTTTTPVIPTVQTQHVTSQVTTKEKSLEEIMCSLKNIIFNTELDKLHWKGAPEGIRAMRVGLKDGDRLQLDEAKQFQHLIKIAERRVKTDVSDRLEIYDTLYHAIVGIGKNLNTEFWYARLEQIDKKLKQKERLHSDNKEPSNSQRFIRRQGMREEGLFHHSEEKVETTPAKPKTTTPRNSK